MDERRHEHRRCDDGHMGTACAQTFEQIAIKQDAAVEAIEKLERRLYYDNGMLSVQTRLDRVDRAVQNMTRLAWILATAIVGLFCTICAGVVLFWVKGS